VKKSDTMQQQCPGKENGSHLGVSSIVPKLFQVFSYALVISKAMWVVKFLREGFKIK
jgi:hypothetical protein